MSLLSGGTYIIQMSESSMLFFDLVREVEASGKFQQILKTQQLKYHLQPFKISGIDCEAIRKIYESIQAKYQVTSQLILDPNSWNQNQRRVFIWFIIFYTYLKDISPTQISQDFWKIFSSTFFKKNPEFLQFQCLNMIKLQGKIAWTPEEDEELVKAVHQEESGKWNEVAKHIFYNSDFKIFKSPKHCRERWLNHLDDKKKRGEWLPQEDLSIFKFVMEYGKHWCKIVPILRDTRTEHMIKNRYNSLINKQRKSKKEREEHLRHRIVKLLKKQISNAATKKKVKDSATEPQQTLKVEDLTPEEKAIEENINTNSKDIQQIESIEPEAVEQVEQVQQSSPQGSFSDLSYYQLYSQPFYNYGYRQNMSPYLYQQPYPYQPYYWM